MSQFKVSKTVQFATAQGDAFTKLQTLFEPERAAAILSILNQGEQKIVTECWDQLHRDLIQHQDPQNMSIPMFMFHFHNYGS